MQEVGTSWIAPLSPRVMDKRTRRRLAQAIRDALTSSDIDHNEDYIDSLISQVDNDVLQAHLAKKCCHPKASLSLSHLLWICRGSLPRYLQTFYARSIVKSALPHPVASPRAENLTLGSGVIAAIIEWQNCLLSICTSGDVGNGRLPKTSEGGSMN